MKRTQLYLKIEVELRPGDDPRKFADELARRLLQSYGVRDVEVSNIIDKDS